MSQGPETKQPITTTSATFVSAIATLWISSGRSKTTDRPNRKSDLLACRPSIADLGNHKEDAAKDQGH